MNTQLTRRLLVALFALALFFASLPAAFADGPVSQAAQRDANWDSIAPSGEVTSVDITRPVEAVADLLPTGISRASVLDTEARLTLRARDGAGLGTDSIIGPTDSRVRINPTTGYPWSAITMLEITRGNGTTTFCSGFFIGRHTVITAGHCVYRADKGGWNRSVRVIPAKNGSLEPFGSQTVSTSALRSTVGWVVNDDARYDFGAVILPNDTLGNRTGTFGYAVRNDATLLHSTINTAGYPGDKAYGTQWYNAGTVNAVNSLTLSYDADTIGGQSGSVVYRIENGNRYAVAVHAYGVGNPCTGNNNCGARVTQSVFNLFTAWRQ